MDVKLPFFKYQGTGNDFVIIDNREEEVVVETELVQAMCARKYGIGSDGLIEMKRSKDASFEMVFYNPDGSQSFCGNGARCAVQFAYDQKWMDEKGTFRASDGLHQAWIGEDEVAISMFVQGEVKQVDEAWFVHTGAPHFVILTEDLVDLDLEKEAAPWRNHPTQLPVGSNVNFVQKTFRGFAIRTFEKGVEQETLSCGTGITAAALVAIQNHWVETDEVEVDAKGGDLRVAFPQNWEEKGIQLIGGAQKVFEGMYFGS